MKRWVATLAALAGCNGAATVGPTHVRATDDALDATPFLATTAEAAAAAGAAELEPIGAAVLSEGEQLGSFMEIPAESCMLAFAQPGDSVRDVDLFVFADDGDRLTSDEAPTATAAVLLCPPHPRRVYVAARAVSGTGMVALGAMTVAPADADAVAAAVDVRGRPGGDTGKLAAWPGLERRIRERREALGSRWEDVRRAAVPLDPRAFSSVSVPIAAKSCLDVLITPNEEVPAVDAHIVDRDGRIVARSRPPGRDRTFVLCSDVDRTITVMMRPRGSGGLAALVVGRSPEGAAPELAKVTRVDGLAPLTTLEQARAGHAEWLAPIRLDPPVSQRATVAASLPLSLPVRLPDGCSRVDVIGGTPLGSFAVALWSDAGEALGSGQGGERVVMYHCGAATSAAVEVSATEAGGPVAVEVRRVGDVPGQFTGHARALGRLLSRLEAERGPVDLAAVADAQPVALERGRRAQQTISGCVDVYATVDALAPARLRLTAGGGDRLERAQGHHGIASLHSCATPDPRPLTVEGEGAGLLLLIPDGD